ncbi:MAG: holo-[acyl-carrier-protein] synthase [Candidatus Melainabacteria bacterium RIFOXYA12_FULL_32_12]|nr:MAG: holo-[acyl-carrier-protein] synthase [Candidatus Melainabacteria bacterium RIFOXYA2_FULL_32_9]OGI31798.1 MAG: holo-[acyl-carrier-protein] synthase [Candidatus Melainabacteria bacterium RIFOXYA12_FULL_32_12]
MIENFFIGTDIECIKRFETIKPDDKFSEKVYTNIELEYCFKKQYPAQHLAVRFAAKEAIIKALSASGVLQVNYTDIEIRNDKNNIPTAKVNTNIMKSYKIKISLSHCEDKAIAFVLLEKVE